jgi:hypothetical protein
MLFVSRKEGAEPSSLSRREDLLLRRAGLTTLSSFWLITVVSNEVYSFTEFNGNVLGPRRTPFDTWNAQEGDTK